MAATALHQPLPPTARASPVALASDSHDDRSREASVAESTSSAGLPPPAPAPVPKKGKGKKGADPVNTSKAIEDTIAQLERSKAGEKDQEIEIGG